MSFTSRDLARAADIYNQMLADPDCSVMLVIAGSTSAGGCMDLYAELVNNMVDAIVATGATIVDMDFFEALGHKHYQALEIPDDDTLRSLYIDRIYDTYIDEEAAAGLRPHDRQDRRQPGAPPLFEPRVHPGNGQVARATATPRRTTAWSSPPMSMTCRSSARPSSTVGRLRPRQAPGRRDEARRPLHGLDAIADFRELTDIKIKAGTTGLLMIGGGVPKNFAQDTVVCAEILGHDDVEVHKYAVQITVADVRDGACSSSTLQEAASWGKVSTALEQMVFAEATSVLPLIASDAYHRGHWKNRAQAPLRQAVRISCSPQRSDALSP